MAAPTSVNIKDMTGTYTLNSKQSDSSQATLKMQGVGWLVRQAVQYSTITLHMKQYTDDKGTVHLDQESISTGNVSSVENRELNGEWGERENKIWGKVKGTTKFRKVSELEDDYLKEGWNQETLDGEVIEAVNESCTDTWTAVQIYGFAEIEGKRKHIRRTVAKKGKQVEKITLVYDYTPHMHPDPRVTSRSPVPSVSSSYRKRCRIVLSALPDCCKTLSKHFTCLSRVRYQGAVVALRHKDLLSSV
ncbi:hypothetical protein KC323_g313 [Hortaea werneckii]|nr:hypothetical protein KC323_g313 [Hortaea werneckii]